MTQSCRETQTIVYCAHMRCSTNSCIIKNGWLTSVDKKVLVGKEWSSHNFVTSMMLKIARSQNLCGTISKYVPSLRKTQYTENVLVEPETWFRQANGWVNHNDVGHGTYRNCTRFVFLDLTLHNTSDIIKPSPVACRKRIFASDRSCKFWILVWRKMKMHRPRYGCSFPITGNGDSANIDAAILRKWLQVSRYTTCNWGIT